MYIILSAMHLVFCICCRLGNGFSGLEDSDGHYQNSKNSYKPPKGVAEVMTRGSVVPETVDNEKSGTMRDRVYSAFTISHPHRQQSQLHSAQLFEQGRDLPDEKVEIAESMEPSLTSRTSDQSSSTVAGDRALAGVFSCIFYAAHFQTATKIQCQLSKLH